MQEGINDKLTKEDIEVLKFLSKYKMLKVEDCSLIYKTRRYYRERVNKLIGKEYIKRYKSYIVLDKKGRKLLGLTGSNYIKNMSNMAYMERLRKIASIATITINSNISFVPSWKMKDKNIYTDTARRYIGKIKIENKEYLIYYISSKKEHVYIKQMVFDINKTIKNENIMIFIEDFNILKKEYAYFTFDKQNTYIILNTNENKEIIKRYHDIDFHEIMQIIYKKEILISDWNEADYLIEKNKYIINMLFLNTEQLQRINWYYKENTNTQREIDIITFEENKDKIREILTNKECKIVTLDKNLLGGMSEI